MTQKNNLRVFVGKNVSYGSGLIDSYEDLSDGGMVIVDETNTVSTDISSLNRWRIAFRKGTQLLYSPWIKTANVIRYFSRSYSAGQEQISYVGYNGTSGSLETSNSKLNMIKILTVDPFKTFGNKQFEKVLSYTTDAAGTQAEIADGLYDSYIANYKHEAEKLLRVERTSAATSIAALTGSAVIYKVTNNSKTVATYIKDADGTAGLTASTASVTADDLISIPSSTSRTYSFTAVALGSSAGHTAVYIGTTAYLVADGGTDAQNATAIAAAINAGTLATAAVSSSTTVTITLKPGYYAPVMVMKSDDDSTWTNVAVTCGDTVAVIFKAAATTSSAATFELDHPWEGGTGYWYEGTTVAKNIGVHTASGAWGLKFTGLPRTNFNPGIFKYLKYRFKLAMLVDGNASTSTITYSQVAKEGQGVAQQVAELEWFAEGNSVNYGQRVVYPGDVPYVLNTDYTTPAKYELIVMQVADDNDVVQITGGSPKSLHEIVLAFYKDSGQGDSMITYLNTGLAPDLSAFS